MQRRLSTLWALAKSRHKLWRPLLVARWEGKPRPLAGPCVLQQHLSRPRPWLHPLQRVPQSRAPLHRLPRRAHHRAANRAQPSRVAGRAHLKGRHNHERLCDACHEPGSHTPTGLQRPVLQRHQGGGWQVGGAAAAALGAELVPAARTHDVVALPSHSRSAPRPVMARGAAPPTPTSARNRFW